ncbi:hypothetical protein DERF_001592 [Dermatophagoides farinae]|uniref:Uncharacterized protein n=1 Tax=Dermatophagoides farinae TaxID=6954 RepID=A0A922IAS6_DERFA|nr:hypothetical protein DERF_001592 [Dermatophagoides farinae]
MRADGYCKRHCFKASLKPSQRLHHQQLRPFVQEVLGLVMVLEQVLQRQIVAALEVIVMEQEVTLVLMRPFVVDLAELDQTMIVLRLNLN